MPCSVFKQTRSNIKGKQRGFTLLELTSSIAILGVLSSTALSKYSDLGRETHIAVLNGVKAALSTATTLTHLQAAMQNKISHRPQQISFGKSQVLVQDGFPAANWTDAIYPIMDIHAAKTNSSATTLCTDFDFCAQGNMAFNDPLFTDLNITSGELVAIWMQGYTLNDQCFAYFHKPSDGSFPRSAIVTTGC